jgi:hypothetical protein
MLSYGTRLKYAFRSFFSLLDYGRIPDDVAEAVLAKPAAAPVPAAPPAAVVETSDRAIQMLALLQRDGRLVDFLMEDLAAYPDAQVGAAVRDVHAGCRAVLTRYATLGPVINDEEGQTVTVARGTDAASVKVIGHAAGEPPYRGVLRHRGWEVSRLELPPLAATGRTIVAPAEVEII